MDKSRPSFGGSAVKGHWPQADSFVAAGFQYWGSPPLVTNRDDDDALARRIAAARAAEASKKDASKREESQGWSVAVEFVGAMLVGGGLGWFIDRWAGTGPWVMIALLLLGFLTGLRSVLRQQNKFDGK
jgi:ATP synthase protein I